MKNDISINERIFDLRVDKGLKQPEIAAALNIPTTTYCDYEQEGNPVPHTVVIDLARYYGVSADYILGLFTNIEPENIPLQSLHLSDPAIEYLRSDTTNTRLISEILSHEAFRSLLLDAEVYVDGYVDDAIQTYNIMLNAGREKITRAAGDVRDANTEALDKVSLVQQDYFAQILAKDFLPILEDIRQNHRKDSSTSDALFDPSLIHKLTETMQETPGGPVRKFAAFVNEFMKIRKTASNMELSEDTIEDPTPENIAELANRSGLIEPNPRKRKSKDAD